MKIIIVLLISAFLLCGCSDNFEKTCFNVTCSDLPTEECRETVPVDEIKVPVFRRRDITKVFLEVPPISQFPNYPAGCESVSTVMALNWAGENVSVDEFIDNHLPQSSEFYWKNGKGYGPSPYEYYLGTPYYEYSWGCMAPVIEKALVSYTGDKNRVMNTTGTDLETLAQTYLANNVPVIVWTTINMLDVVDEFSWHLPDGTLYNWPGNEHCMLLVGYDEEMYYFNDPYRGMRVGYPKDKVEKRYEQLGKQSIVVN